MSQQPQLLSVDEAMAEFMRALPEVYGDILPAPGTPRASREEIEANHFRLAEHLLHLACPDAGACTDQRCRRDRLCRHLAFVRDKREKGIATHPRRTPGTEAFRYAVWVLVNTAGVR